MKRLPTEDQLRTLATEIGGELIKLSLPDLDRVIAAIETQRWECEQEALANLQQDTGDYYAGGIDYLNSLLDGFLKVRDAKARQN
jgi:hypothetical protein